MANNVRFIKAKKAFGNFSLPVDMVYVLDSDIDNEQYKILKKYGCSRREKDREGNVIVYWTFGGNRKGISDKMRQSMIDSTWERINKAMNDPDINGVLINENELNNQENNDITDNNLAENDVDLESSEVVNELDELIENLEFDRTKIKEKLISFKQDLMNCLTVKELQTKLEPIIKKRNHLSNVLGDNYSFANTILIMIQDPEATYVLPKSKWFKWGRGVVEPAPRIWLWVPKDRSSLSGEEKEQIIYDYLKSKGVKKVDDLKPNEKIELNELLRYNKTKKFKLTPDFYDIRFTKVRNNQRDHFTEHLNQVLNSENNQNTINNNAQLNANGEYIGHEGAWFDDFTQESVKTKKIYEALYKAVSDEGIKIRFVNNLNGARGVSRNGIIDLLTNQPINAGYVGDFAHEFAHEILHQKFLSTRNEELYNFYVGRSDNTRAMREQQAELCAWMVLKTYGLYYKTNEVYLKNWGLNENTIVEIFDNMSNTASYIIEKINQNLGKIKNNMTESVKLNESLAPSGFEIAQMLGVGDLYMKGLEHEEMKNQEMYNEPQMNMESMQIKLSESEFKEFLTEAVKNVLNELNWRTYHNAAMKDYDKKRAQKFADKRDELFNSEYEYNDHKNGNFIRMQGNYNDPRLEMITNGNLDADRTHYIKHNGDTNYGFRKNYTSGYEKFPNANGDKKLARAMAKAHDGFNTINNKYENGKYEDNNEKTDFHAFLGKKI